MSKIGTRFAASVLSFSTATVAFMAQVLAQSYDYSYTSSSTGDPTLGIVFMCCGLLVGLVFAGVIGYLVYKDAVKNNVDNPMLWAILCAVFGLIPLLIYFLAIRNKS